MRRTAVLLVAFVAACADPNAPNTLAGQRLEVGDQRLIGYIPAVVHGMTVTVPGVRCDRVGFPVQVYEAGPNPDIVRRELAFIAEFNREMAASPYYSAAECRVFEGPDGDYALGPAMDGELASDAWPRQETFEQIFGFPAP